jgi:hypothetical protein
LTNKFAKRAIKNDLQELVADYNELLSSHTRIEQALDAGSTRRSHKNQWERNDMADRTFEFLLNAFEAASQSKNPAEHGYADKRSALFSYVAAIQSKAVTESEQSALQRYAKFTKDDDSLSPLEQLRFFCSLAMSGQDWLDVERFFNVLEYS